MEPWQRGGRKNRLVTNERIQPGNVVVGLASYGKTVYEKEYNSGIGSNGLTSARHDVLQKKYARDFPETFDASLEDEVVYIGKHDLAEQVNIRFRNQDYSTNMGKLLLSPTRTFAPVLKKLLEEEFGSVHGLIHCSGGGQTKCMKYLPHGVHVVKDNLFPPPEIFRIIQLNSGADDREMMQVFNMGCRMEIYTNEKAAERIIAIAQSFGVDAQVIGRVEPGKGKQLSIKNKEGIISYTF